MTGRTDLERLEHQLEEALERIYGKDIRVAKLIPLAGGASRQTFQFDVKGPGRDPIELILRRDFPGRPSLPGNMGLEDRVLRAAREAGLAVPEVIISCNGPDYWDTAGIVMSRVDGETIARRILRDSEFSSARQVLASQCGDFLAGLHRLKPSLIDGLAGFDPLATCRQTYDELRMPSPTFEYAFRWLTDHAPPPPTTPCIVHGDFRLGNLIVNENGLAAVLDWEGVHLGDPLEDLGWLCVKAWRFGATLPVAGVGTYGSLIEAYEDAEGLPVDRDLLAWWQVFGTLRWGVICMAQATFHLTGAVRSVELAAIGRRVCEQEWDLMLLLRPDAIGTLETSAENQNTSSDFDLHGSPTLEELLASVREFLDSDLLPATQGRTHFLTRVAINVLATAEREVALSSEQEARFAEQLARLGCTSTLQLAEGVRNGSFDDQDEILIQVLATIALERLKVANPAYLELPDRGLR